MNAFDQIALYFCIDSVSYTQITAHICESLFICLWIILYAFITLLSKFLSIFNELKVKLS